MKCFNCDKEFELNKGSDEHILSYSLGGRIHSKKLICKECNSEFSPLERELNDQYGWISKLLEFKRGGRREIKSIPMVDDQGRISDLNSDFTPIHKIRIEKKDGSFKEHLFESEEKFNQMMKKFSQIYPNHNKEEREEHPILYPRNNRTDKTTISFGLNHLYFKHMFKVGIEFYLYHDLPISDIQFSIQNFREDKVKGRVDEFLPPRPIYSPKEGELSHIIYLRVDPRLKMIYCWVSYFNMTSSIVFLNDNYQGQEKREIVYGWDVIQNQNLDLKPSDIDLSINPKSVRDRGDKKMYRDSEVFDQSFGRVWNIILSELSKKGKIKPTE
jgi:hypothetical protein